MIKLTSLLFDRIFSSLKIFKFYTLKKNTGHSHYVRFQLLLFSHVVAQKRSLVKLENYWWITASCHQFVQPTDFISVLGLRGQTKTLCWIQHVNKNATFQVLFSFNHQPIHPPFVPNAPFLFPLKTLRFSDVLGGREMAHWKRIG